MHAVRANSLGEARILLHQTRDVVIMHKSKQSGRLFFVDLRLAAAKQDATGINANLREALFELRRLGYRKLQIESARRPRFGHRFGSAVSRMLTGR
jgi:hypothetical protein